MRKTNFIKSSIVIAFMAAGSTACSFAEHGRSTTPGVNGTTVEVRYVANSPNRKASKPSKLIITRDSNGKVISVKRSH